MESVDICQVLNVITFLAEYPKCTPKHMGDGGVITSRKLAQDLMIQGTTKDMFRLYHDLIRQPGNAVFVHQHYSKFKYPFMADAAYKVCPIYYDLRSFSAKQAIGAAGIRYKCRGLP